MYGLTAENVNRRSSSADWNPKSSLKKCKTHINIPLQSQICWYGLPVSFSSICPDALSTNSTRIFRFKPASSSLRLERMGFNFRPLCLLLSNSFHWQEQGEIVLENLYLTFSLYCAASFFSPSVIPMFLCGDAIGNKVEPLTPFAAALMSLARHFAGVQMLERVGTSVFTRCVAHRGGGDLFRLVCMSSSQCSACRRQ